MEFLKYDYKYFIRDDKVLIIFPEKPFWFVGDLSILEVVKYFSKEIDYDLLKYRLKNKFNYLDVEEKEVLLFVKELFKSAELFADKVNIEDKLLEVFPNAVINLTKNCNLKCKHCYANAGKHHFVDEMSFEELKGIIDIIINLYNKYSYDKRVLLSGGEPFLRKDIINIIEYIHSKDAIPAINTNGLLILEKHLEILKRCNCELLISLDGANQKSHEYIRGRNTYYNTLDKIKMLRDYGVNTKISMTVHKDNLCELEAFLEIAKKYKVNGVAINPLNIFCRAEESGLQRVDISELYKELKRLSQKSDSNFYYISKTDYANLGAILLMNIRFHYCGVGSASLVVDYNGDIYPCYNTMCSEFKLGNIKKDDILKIWNSSEILKKLRALNVNDFSYDCKCCEVKYYCGGGCRGEALYQNKKIISKCPYCSEIKKSILDLMFELGNGNNELFKNRMKFFEYAKSLYKH
ncbi:radical SAM/SPASM domain-containing protein [Parvimonas parva]|uniref:Radical SAM protein n=1 Tax=Parvimonas parva TaxID=2769485 RepID=A0ABS1C8D1_9FIRM|nr:radical SAM protein [Parvimonas parva]MBK1468356.1 radical SAM protein [Parvimonas parva]